MSTPAELYARLEETKNVEKRLPNAADEGDGTDDATESGDAGLGSFIVLADNLVEALGAFLDTTLAAGIRTRTMLSRWTVSFDAAGGGCRMTVDVGYCLC